MGVEFRREGLVTMTPRGSAPVKWFGELSFEEIKALKTELINERTN